MISQRELSRLVNRLYEEARQTLGRQALRLPEETVERDYCLAWLLCSLSRHATLGESLAFKGGTALRRIHYGEYRFSEDLDFTLVAELPFDTVLNGFAEVFAETERESDVRFWLRGGDGAVANHQRNDTCYFEYQGPRLRPSSVKVDVTRSETVVFPLQRKPVLRTYQEFDLPEDRQLLVYSLEEIVVEKTLAVTDSARREPRDLYDLWYIFDSGLVADPELMVEGLSRKLASRPGRNADVLVPKLDNAERVLRKAWANRLSAQVSMLPVFDGCFRRVRRSLSRFDELRDTGRL